MKLDDVSKNKEAAAMGIFVLLCIIAYFSLQVTGLTMLIGIETYPVFCPNHYSLGIIGEISHAALYLSSLAFAILLIAAPSLISWGLHSLGIPPFFSILVFAPAYLFLISKFLASKLELILKYKRILLALLVIWALLFPLSTFTPDCSEVSRNNIRAQCLARIAQVSACYGFTGSWNSSGCGPAGCAIADWGIDQKCFAYPDMAQNYMADDAHFKCGPQPA